MKIEQTLRMTPHIIRDGKVELLGWSTYDQGTYSSFGIPCTEGPVDVPVSIDIDVQTMSVAACNTFDSAMQTIRADAAMKIEQLQEEKQRFLAIES